MLFDNSTNVQVGLYVRLFHVDRLDMGALSPDCGSPAQDRPDREARRARWV